METDCDKSDHDKWEDNIKISERLVSMGGERKNQLTWKQEEGLGEILNIWE